MADITLCLSETCPQRRQCFRHEAPPKRFGQSYHAFTQSKGDECEWFVPLKEKLHGKHGCSSDTIQ